MKLPTFFHKTHLISFIISVLLFFIFAFLFKYTILLEGLENGAINFRFYYRNPTEKSKKLQEGARQYKENPRARKDIVIVGIDEETIRHFNDELGLQWPFPWEVHAKVARFLGTADPLAIFFDILFLDHKPGEQALAKAFTDVGNIFIDYPFETEEFDYKYQDIQERLAILDRYKIPLAPNDTHSPWIEEAVPPPPLLASAARGIGYANIRPDEDHINRKLPLIIKFNGYYYPSIDLLLVMHYFGVNKDNIEVSMGHYIKLTNVDIKKMKKPNPSREIEIPIDDEGFMNINFIGGPGSFLHIPYYYFYSDGSFSNDSLKDKIVLIAAYSATGISSDIHKSPYGETFGVEHHANALNTILNQDFLVNLTQGQNILILLIIALILGLILPRLSIVMSIIFTFTFALAYVIIANILFDHYNIIYTLSTPLIQTGTTFSFIIVMKLITEQSEKRHIRQTFSKFVSKSVVDELLKHPEKVKLGGDRKLLTVLFSDIRGFTTISEKLSAEELVEHLNEYLQAMTDIVIKYNGTLDKYVGDEIMAFWGAPIPQEDHALLACKAALEMMDVLNALNRNWRETGNKPPLFIGIGINSGEMVVGNMGSHSRMDYTLMGDNVNLGARLEGTNKIYGTNIIISEFTYQLVNQHVVARELDLIRVKGKETPVTIYELLALKED